MIDLRDRELWMRAVLSDDRLTDSAARVAMRLALHLNLTDGRCDPSMQTLARGCGAKTRTAERAIAQLESLGFISRVRSGGGRFSNSYRFRFDSLATIETAERQNNRPPSVETGGNADAPDRSDGAPPSVETGHPRQSRRPNIEENIEENMEGGSPPNPSSHDRRNRRRSAEADSEPEGFSAWWDQYPRQTGEAGARKAYGAALREGATPGDLMAGVLRYAAERMGQEERYTKTPSNWLHDGCWTDKPASKPVPARPASNGRSAPVSYLDREKKRMGL